MSNDDERTSPAEARVRVIDFVRELTAVLTSATTVSDLFQVALRALHDVMPFDVGVALLVEHHLEICIEKRANLEKIIDDRFGTLIREALESDVTASLSSFDLVIREDHSDLPARECPEDPLENRVHTALRVGGRTLGMLWVARGSGPFTVQEQERLEIAAIQCTMLLNAIRTHERMQNLADSDDLTGIWNKRYFRRQFPIEVERARIYNLPLSLLMFDLDDFKVINDRYGHTIGDVVLSELCGSIRETLRPPDLFARFGGDEFALVLPHTDMAGAISVAERIVRRVVDLRIPLADGVEPIRCSVSIGLSFYHSHGIGANDLIQRADERLYESKRMGKNRYSY